MFSVPHRTPFFLPKLFPSLTWRIQNERKELYLTFDDGPVPGPTEFVLDTLASRNIKATFFCIGDNIRKHPEVFKKIIEQGHAVGNHTFNHLNGWKTNSPLYVENIKKCDDIIKENAPQTSNLKPQTKLFRPPYGRITKKQIQALSDYKIIMWDVLSVDYNKNLSPEKCLGNTIGATRSGSIIVFHDSDKAEKNLMYALPSLIDHFVAQGFTFHTLQ
ncbi:MAG TPA: polysaccharide deacetylase family protein [Chryseolinea sp.]|nr:polysaccharide deacetylase family protein [Chryseolinea sp.]HPH46235.1 polysaccharide deacetylase family protein [Chryseolinea sp.]HPM30508.1 polysaccharide deacetylase family protein [Chryseolinea sp.]